MTVWCVRSWSTCATRTASGGATATMTTGIEQASDVVPARADEIAPDGDRDRRCGAASPPRPSSLLISAQLDDGQWLNVGMSVPEPSPRWALPSLLSMGVMAVALSLIVIFMVRRITRPMAQLAAAAESVGRGETVTPLARAGAARRPPGHPRVQPDARPPAAVRPGSHPDARGDQSRSAHPDHVVAAARRVRRGRGDPRQDPRDPRRDAAHDRGDARVRARGGGARGDAHGGSRGADREPVPGSRRDGHGRRVRRRRQDALPVPPARA